MGELASLEIARKVLEDAHIGLWAIELDAGAEPRMYADATMRGLLGITDYSDLTPEAVYRAWYGRIDAAHYDQVNESVEKMTSGMRAEVQYPWHHPTRGEIWVRCAGLLDRSYTKGVRLQGRHQDISDVVHIQRSSGRRELEQRAAASREALLSGITKTLYGYDLRVDLDTLKYAVIPGTGMESSVEFLRRTDDYLVAYEKKLSHVVGCRDDLSRILSPENLRAVARAGHSGLYRTLEYPILLMSGYSGWEEMSVFIDTDSDGRPQCNVLVRDVTEAHERAARRERELRAAAAKDALLSGITRMLYGYNLTVDLSTQKYEVIIGSGMDDIISFIAENTDYPTVSEQGLAMVTPEFRGRLREVLSLEGLRRAAAEGRTGLLGTFEYELLFEGVSHWHEISVFLGPNETGVFEASILGRDITEQHRRVENRLQAEREVNAAKSYFFSTVSHDLRTPLNAIIGFSELLEMGVADEAERTRYLSSIRSSSRVLMDLINDVLDLSKLEAGKMEIETEPTDLWTLVEEIRSAFALEASRKGLFLEVDLAGCCARHELDPQRIRQVLFNLVGNAVKFTEKGGITIRVRQRPCAAEGCCGLELAVSDTGCGIAQTDQAKLMMPFVQVHGQGRHGGTGLGLAICRQLAQRMGGELTLRSLYGAGSTFTLSLPQVKIVTATEAAPAPAPVVKPPVVCKRAKRVLVVDDSSVNLAVLRALLERCGCRDIVTAADGREALAYLLNAERPFDLVLTDLWMPDMDGDALVRAIRANPKFDGLPVYAVTADVEAQKDYMTVGFTGLLLKPLTLASLAPVLA